MDRTPRYAYPPASSYASSYEAAFAYPSPNVYAPPRHPLEQRVEALEAQVQELQHLVRRLSYEPYWAPPVETARNPPPQTLYPQCYYKVLASLPPVDSSNPIAALINYCKHYLHYAEEIFQHETETITNGFIVRVVVFGQDLANVHRLKKITARSDAAKQALAYLHNNPGFIVEHAVPEQ